MRDMLINRVGRLVSGSFNALIDAVENSIPEAVMEEAIREIDSAIDEVRTELGKTHASRHLASTRLMEENKKHDRLAENIEIAIKEDRDDLAEAAISQQLDIEAQIPVLEETIAECGAQEKELEGYIAALQAKKREMSDELRDYRKSNPLADGSPSQESIDSAVESKVNKAESAFQRVFEKTTGVSGVQNMDASNAKKIAELEELAQSNRIKERLAALKSENE